MLLNSARLINTLKQAVKASPELISGDGAKI